MSSTRRGHAHEDVPEEHVAVDELDLGGVLKLHPGDRVVYHVIGGGSEKTPTATGTVEEILIADFDMGHGRHAHASERDPRLVIRNDHTQKTTPYKAEAIVGLADDATGEASATGEVEIVEDSAGADDDAEYVDDELVS
ncbi:hypothetical protein H9P43_004304 [Blastocladiella emersonii ATCC 22665]|nr:hypothetical protein H9P43_004304 [Blastocladiella emersonii ATCC 22665]